MAINKVVYGNDTLIDLTNDTVEASNLLEGETAHDRSGTPVTGTAKQGHTIWNKIKSALTQRAKLWFKDAKVTDDSSESATVVEVLQSISENDFDSLPTDGTADGLYEIDGESSGSGGHTIKDGDGTAMTAQPNLQFADANVSNDGTNNATVVRNFVDIDWDDWQEVDDNDNTYYRVTDAPLVDGNVEVDLMKKLWENPAPTASFVAQDITLASDDYDMLLWFYKEQVSTSYYLNSMSPKGVGTSFNLADLGGSGNTNRIRRVTRTDDTHYAIGNGFRATSSTYASDDTVMIPTAVYGIKQKVTISLSAIISNVSTSANNCMMPDGVTSVADALEELEIKSASFSGTSNADGNIQLTTDMSRVPIGIKLDTQGYFSYCANFGNMGWYAHIMDSRGTLMQNATVAGTYYYI